MIEETYELKAEGRGDCDRDDPLTYLIFSRLSNWLTDQVCVSSMSLKYEYAIYKMHDGDVRCMMIGLSTLTIMTSFCALFVRFGHSSTIH